ncbi:hypothetical protein PoB_002833200 [Plakobranchus ocellatus]|uniref:Uncharacterized protein n=1 Tax=Plakobranchus ocellatus TaxID=259542 RepID=A0AAV4A4P9_9GAST|nr:hypothetical protein PoB_002833200 [Plakobranchus ocellatus]
MHSTSTSSTSGQKQLIWSTGQPSDSWINIRVDNTTSVDDKQDQLDPACKTDEAFGLICRMTRESSTNGGIRQRSSLR